MYIYIHTYIHTSGLEAQGISTIPDEWDTPDVVAMLTRSSVKTKKRPKSGPGGTLEDLTKKDESGEMYRFGVSQVSFACMYMI